MKLMKDYLNKKLGDGEGRLHSSADTSRQIKPAEAGLVCILRSCKSCNSELAKPANPRYLFQPGNEILEPEALVGCKI
ncbi:hypothetical protein NIES4073_12330 [Kalymmatonema gypsitolerans NIES-4073]|nr:hypothetical protein NIES4073_12330 [Scytonema sp. NIES-4073]